MYRYCKCDDCREAMSTYLKKWRKKRKTWKTDLPEVRYGT
jgi:hypothetical protein